MHWYGRTDVRGDSSPLIDYFVEYIDNADITLICILKKQWVLDVLTLPFFLLSY